MKIFDGIDTTLADWIRAQALFFVGTAPTGADGHVNVSPKGPIGSLRISGPLEVAYLDHLGSGSETIAHLRENGRICVMLCAFAGPPRIVRLHGRGEVIQVGTPGFAAEAARLGFEPGPGARSIIRVAVERVADSCGYDVPLLSVEGARPQRAAWEANRLKKEGPAGLVGYIREHNATSIDGLPAVEVAVLPA